MKNNTTEYSNYISKWCALVLTFSKRNIISISVLLILSIGFMIFNGAGALDVFKSTAVLDSQGVVERELIAELVYDFFTQEKSIVKDGLISHQSRYTACDGMELLFVDITFNSDYNFSDNCTEFQNYICSNPIVSKEFNPGQNSCDLIAKNFQEKKALEKSVFSHFGSFMKAFCSGILILLVYGQFRNPTRS